MNKKYLLTILLALATGIGLSFTIMFFLKDSSGSSNTEIEKKPLYWVAPMDSNYRRDKPGKSPMGMDLVPVYDEKGGASKSPGTVTIYPNVVNNLSIRKGIVKRQPLTNKISSVGYIQYDETSLTRVTPRVEGWVEQLFVNFNGQYIEKGEPIYTLYSPVLVSAQKEYLLARRGGNDRLLQAAKRKLESLGFARKEFQKINQTGKALDNVTFYSKSSGVVDNLSVREGLNITPNTTLMTVGTLDNIWVEVEIFSRQLPFIKKGQQAMMELESVPSKQWSGTVDYIYPSINATNRAAKVRLEFDNAEQLLKPNMFVDVTIYTQSEMPVLQVPIEAVIRTETNDRVVLSSSDGEFKSVSVKTGRVTNDSIEILNGLEEGDEVVLSGHFLIDSESSIDSDFKRLSGQTKDKAQVPSAMVNGIVNNINHDDRLVNISRDAIPKWNRGPAILDFELADNISLSEFREGEQLHFTFEILDDRFVITQIHKKSMEH